MWLFFSSCVVAAFAITFLSSGIISESRYQLVSRWIIDFVYIWVTNLHILTHGNSRSYASRIRD